MELDEGIALAMGFSGSNLKSIIMVAVDVGAGAVWSVHLKSDPKMEH